jgi:peptidoglycan/LPS O-acetylase OafA/YrhL
MKFRQDIQGLRAVAVVLVIFHHFFPATITGGYIGVDIFFVISGFLITNILTNQRSLTAPKLLFDFYARRIRRILPIAILGILIGSLMAQLLLGSVFGADTRRDGVFALLFIANWHFNDLAIDYFSSGLPPSIFQHYWSLSVEEQFYLLWPLLILLSRRWSRGPLLTIGAITFFSLLHSMLQVNAGSTTAFFATSTRIWELGAGALLALSRINAPNKALAMTNLVLIFLFSTIFDSETGFPGAPALLVVLATATLLATSQDNRALSNRAIVYLGDISFSLYIWHWILIQGARLYLGEEPANLLKIALLLATLLVSAASSSLIENPIRTSAYLKARPKITVVVGATALALAIFAIKLPEVL